MGGIARAAADSCWLAAWHRMTAAVVLTLVAAMPAASRELLVEPAPRWVYPIPVPLEAKAPPGSSTGGVEYLLSDRQTRLEPHDSVATTTSPCAP